MRTPNICRSMYRQSRFGYSSSRSGTGSRSWNNLPTFEPTTDWFDTFWRFIVTPSIIIAGIYFVIYVSANVK